MAKLNNLLITGVVLCTFLALIDGGLIIGKGKHDRFFKKLSPTEKQALMALAISRSHIPPSTNHTGIFPEYPITKPRTEEIPNTLFTTMMNGGVPNQWMTQFIQWLRRSHGMTDQSFFRYLSDEKNQLCRGNADNAEDCVTLETLQKSCCPFG